MKTASILTISLLAIFAAVCKSSAVSPPGPLNVCQKPANVTLAIQSAQDLCANANCVDTGGATLMNSGSQICQAPDLPQGVFSCTQRGKLYNQEAKHLDEYGRGICAMPADSTTYALYVCDNGAKVNVYTRKDGTASYFVGRHSIDAPGAAGYDSQRKNRRDDCKPLDVIGETNVINDKLIIDCDGHHTICPVEG